MDIHATIIPREQHRPEVDGCDWYFDSKDNLNVLTSSLGDWRYDALLQIHELIEAVLCKHAGITQQQVDLFDQSFDVAHPNQPDLGAGDDPSAPYFRQHVIATACESIVAHELGVDWNAYNKELADRFPGPSKR